MQSRVHSRLMKSGGNMNTSCLKLMLRSRRFVAHYKSQIGKLALCSCHILQALDYDELSEPKFVDKQRILKAFDEPIRRLFLSSKRRSCCRRTIRSRSPNPMLFLRSAASTIYMAMETSYCYTSSSQTA